MFKPVRFLKPDRFAKILNPKFKRVWDFFCFFVFMKKTEKKAAIGFIFFGF